MTFREQLTAATSNAFRDLKRRIGKERLYAFALYTSGADDFCYVVASANTEEQLAGREELRWSACDWAYHSFSPEVEQLELPDGEGEQRDEQVYEDMVAALKAQRCGPRTMRLILCGDMGDEFFLRGMRRLNSSAKVQAYLDGLTHERFLAGFTAGPGVQGPDAWLELWQDLALDRRSSAGDEARAAQVSQYHVQERVVALGAAAIPGLIRLVGSLAPAPAFNEPGSLARARHGASTPESSLATSAVFTIGDIDQVTDKEVTQLQALLGDQVRADETLTIASTLAENIARVLHGLRPERFPESQLDPSTNHLRNPEPFVQRTR